MSNEQSNHSVKSIDNILKEWFEVLSRFSMAKTELMLAKLFLDKNMKKASIFCINNAISDINEYERLLALRDKD